MNCLTGQLIVKHTVGWPGEGPLAAKSSAALNKQIDSHKIGFYFMSNMSNKYTEIPTLFMQKQVKLCQTYQTTMKLHESMLFLNLKQVIL